MPPRLPTTAALTLILSLAAMLAARAYPAAQGTARDARALFRVQGEPVSRGRVNRPWVTRSRVVALDSVAWEAATRRGQSPGPSELLLNLFDDTSFVAALDRIDPAPGGLTWTGHIPGRTLSTVTLTTVNGVMAGSIIMPGAVYAVRHAGGSSLEISEIDQAQFPAEAEPLPYSGATLLGAPVEAGTASGADDGSTIDVMVLYTPAATASAGGASGIAARINLAISEANTSYGNSGITQRLRLVHSEQTAYTESNDLRVDLSNVTNRDGSAPRSTPLGDAAAALRNVYGADLVVLVTSPPSPLLCGVAWLMDPIDPGFEAFAFSVIDEGCMSPNFTLTHELGHNMGNRHDWYVDNTATPATHAHGYVNPAARWRTIMAYNDQCSVQSFNCTRLLYWSNPGVLYGGAPMGIPRGTRSVCPKGVISDVSCDADDHRTLNDTALTVANFRQSVRRPASDFTADLKSDVLWHHQTRGEVWLWPMNGPTKMAESYVRTVAELGWAIRGLGDQTGDGRADILWRHAASGTLYLWTMSGGDVVAETYVGTVDPGYGIVGTGDYNGDGKSDILWRHFGSGQLWVWLMSGAVAQVVSYVDTVNLDYTVAGSGDLDGDRKADILWRHATRGDVWAWLMNGAAPRERAYVMTVPDLGYEMVGVADHTGDGKADVLWHHNTRGEVWLWPMDGVKRIGQTHVGTVPDSGYRIASSGDYDGDGKADILWHHATRGEVWVWLMSGAVKASEKYVTTMPEVQYRIVRTK